MVDSELWKLEGAGSIPVCFIKNNLSLTKVPSDSGIFPFLHNGVLWFNSTWDHELKCFVGYME